MRSGYVLSKGLCVPVESPKASCSSEAWVTVVATLNGALAPRAHSVPHGLSGIRRKVPYRAYLTCTPWTCQIICLLSLASRRGFRPWWVRFDLFHKLAGNQ